MRMESATAMLRELATNGQDIVCDVDHVAHTGRVQWREALEPGSMIVGDSLP